MHKVVIIGAGQVGKTLAYLLHRSSKYKVIGIYKRRLNDAKNSARFIGKDVRVFRDKFTAVSFADIVFITTPDSVIQKVADEIFTGTQKFSNKIILHCSGSFSSKLLRSAKRHKNVFIGSLHPLQTFAHPEDAVRTFRGTYCVYEGETKALQIIKGIIKALKGIPIQIKAKDKYLYHIGCVFASNYFVCLINTAVNFLKLAGFNDKDALQSLQPLINTTLKNIKTLGTTNALTGPIARGDILTIKNHLKAIRVNCLSYLPLYKELGKHTLKIALDKKCLNTKKSSIVQMFKSLKVQRFS
jgi:predicted short-subunit dehydrogenase-like oxidoreductase (DUF2520 family)